MSDETKIFTKNDKNGDKCASGGQESGLKLIFERGVAILVRPWRFPGQPKKFVFFSIKVGTINSGTSLDSREQFKKTGKLEINKKFAIIFCFRFRFKFKSGPCPGKYFKKERNDGGKFIASELPAKPFRELIERVFQEDLLVGSFRQNNMPQERPLEPFEIRKKRGNY